MLLLLYPEVYKLYECFFLGGRKFAISLLLILFFNFQWPKVANTESAFYKGTSNYSNCRTFEKHDSSEKHQRCVEASLVQKEPEKAPLNAVVARLTKQQNLKMLQLF